MLKPLLESYSRGYDKLSAVLEGLTEDELSFKPAPNAWSIKEIVVHLADTEMVAAYRMKLVISELNPPLQAFDQDLWTSRQQYSNLNMPLHLEWFRTTRAALIDMLQHIEPSDLARKGVHNEAGELTLEKLLRKFDSHVDQHIGQIQRNLAAYRNTGAI